jgi:signal transduction histidine kinase
MAPHTPHPGDLRDAIERLGPSDHLCMSYSTPQEKLAAAVPFVRRGLERREHCVYIADGATRSNVLEVMQSEGIAVDHRGMMDAGALSILGCKDTYRREETFEPERMLTWVRQRAEDARRAGFSALRLVGEMTCVADSPDFDARRLAEYEAKFNNLVRDAPVSALCAYDRHRFSADIIREVIATHPLVVVGATVCRNPFFVPPDDYLSPDWAAREIEWLLDTLRHIQLVENDLRESEERYRVLARRLLEVQETERRAIARELHDDLGQILTTLKIKLRAAASSWWGRSRTLAENLPLVDEAMEHMREAALKLRPPILDDLGLASALRWYVSRQLDEAGLALELDVHAIESLRLPPDLETTCFRLVQEAVTNIVRHASARSIAITVRTTDHAVEVVVQDDGHGFDVDAARAHAAAGASLGLLSMEERAVLAGGSLMIESVPGGGTTIRARLPLPTK